MVRRRKSKIGPVEIVVVGAIAAIAAVPKKPGFIGIIVVIVLIVFFAFKWPRTSASPISTCRPCGRHATGRNLFTDHDADEPVSVRSTRRCRIQDAISAWQATAKPAGFTQANRLRWRACRFQAA